MPSPSRTNRFQSFTPLRSTSGSLRRLKTAFSPNRNSMRSASPSSIISSSTTPLTRNSSPHSHRSSGSSIRQLLAVRRKPSMYEFEMEEEKHLFEQELDVLEPRPSMGRGTSEVHVVGIFEVLDGKC
ncbi:hypothetical protein GT037_005159 [Alternaria burnsii]|uniref:Uncharacterized protein n=4 Tax=Alternaria sect. Alternaria TaxID=2499237 RepID=A0A177DSZ1_ALTAL|nr:hypothetical protein CC77DRAFT_1060011 [Alternaria alternata]XP_038787156.1 uncharacterized protein GT037_005159 [Alternaria burnsii]XP_051584218.1 uncharacterized protein J4E82_009823 [Alternaria postmessia]KAB2101281.1 hypothetical protein AG0111_0g10288 [Alternaria gaisen]RII08521.1 hypothetical protein CUC08_Gglean007934 [Alternaria sp. MG1]RYN38257.1 hypothetical protein AA0115_g553 [Alternaria tenuissima]KAF7676947.1 hypothetical protein GT037_005159 [Alternaria burnsii]KAH6839027.1